MTQAYPLHWPDGWPRTRHRTKSRFKAKAEAVRKSLFRELRLLGAASGRTVISSNVRLRQDGMPYASEAGRGYDDPGVAVYFMWKGRPFVMARDTYRTPHENLNSIVHAIEAMRALERHGGSHMMERAFSGFSALPPPETPQTSGAKPKRKWFEVLGCASNVSASAIISIHRKLIMENHPDRGGSHDAMAEINAARDEGLRIVGRSR